MKFLLAKEFATGRYSKVGVYNARKDGSISLAAKRFHGTMLGLNTRKGVKFLMQEPAATEVFFAAEEGKYRLTKI